MTAVKIPAISQGTSQLLADIRVLVVDDDADTVMLVQRFLTNAGAVPMAALNVGEALALFGQHRPDVIVSDITMPDGDGYSFMRRVRARSIADGGGTPAIALTGNTGPIHHSRALLAGYQVHLAKPINAVELVTAIQQLVAPH